MCIFCSTRLSSFFFVSGKLTIKVFSRDEQYVFGSSLKDKVLRLNTEPKLKDVTFAVAAMFLTLEGLLVIIWMQKLVRSVATALGNRIEPEGNTI